MARYTNTLRDEVWSYIDSSPKEVILRQDLNKLGNYRQVSRAIQDLITDQKLVKIGYGIYAKSQPSDYSTQALIKASFAEICIQALNRLHVEWEPSQAIQDYNQGKTQQVPVYFSVRLKKRYRGKLKYGKRELLFEGNINAK